MKARQVVGARKLGCAVEGAARVTARVPTSPAKGLGGNQVLDWDKKKLQKTLVITGHKTGFVISDSSLSG